MEAKYYLTSGFDPSWETTQFEQEIVNKYTSDKQFDLIINSTWGFLECENPVTKEISNKFEITKYLVEQKLVKTILFYNFVDPIYDLSTWYEVFDHCKKYIHEDDIVTLGQIDTNKMRLNVPFQYWAVFVADHFEHYLLDDLRPKSFDNLYLCYNRKPTWHRVELYNKLESKNLLNKGIYTLGHQDPDKVKMVNADKTTIPFNDSKTHGQLNIANDTMTLGNMDLWNSHFVTIVNETQHVKKLGYPFLSEKIWKPIIGLRPFLCVGDQGTTQLLEDAGFYTFNDLFDIQKPDPSIDDVVKAIENCKLDPAQTFEKIEPKLIHNNQRIFEYAKEQKQIFDL